MNDKGGVAEEGSVDDLLKKAGAFSVLREAAYDELEARG